MQADARIGIYMVGGRDGCSPIVVPQPFHGDVFNVYFEADETAIPQMLERNNPAYSRIFPYCLGETNGPGTFYLNYDPFTSSLLKPSTEFDLTQWYVNREYPHADVMRNVRQVPVELRAMDSLNLLDDPAVAAPSIIVLDTQGTELSILRGGRELVTEHTMAIVTEAEFVRFYEGQPLFGEICTALDEMGFMFVDFTAGPFRVDSVPRAARPAQPADDRFLRRALLAQTVGGHQTLSVRAALVRGAAVRATRLRLLLPRSVEGDRPAVDVHSGRPRHIARSCSNSMPRARTCPCSFRWVSPTSTRPTNAVPSASTSTCRSTSKPSIAPKPMPKCARVCSRSKPNCSSCCRTATRRSKR